VRIDHRLVIAVALFAGCGAPGEAAHAQEAPAYAPEGDVALSSDVGPEPPTVDGCQVIARIDGQVVLACELLWRVNIKLEENRDKIPPAQYEAVRDQLMQMTLAGMIDQKLLYGEFRRNVPAENMPRIEENLQPYRC
jgi:hypothetical protein